MGNTSAKWKLFELPRAYIQPHLRFWPRRTVGSSLLGKDLLDFNRLTHNCMHDWASNLLNSREFN